MCESWRGSQSGKTVVGENFLFAYEPRIAALKITDAVVLDTVPKRRGLRAGSGAARIGSVWPNLSFAMVRDGVFGGKSDRATA